jgi:hypothetical protein
VGFTDVEHKLASRLDRASARDVKRVTLLHWITAVCYAPDMEMEDRVVKIRQLLARRGFGYLATLRLDAPHLFADEENGE